MGPFIVQMLEAEEISAVERTHTAVDRAWYISETSLRTSKERARVQCAAQGAGFCFAQSRVHSLDAWELLKPAESRVD